MRRSPFLHLLFTAMLSFGALLPLPTSPHDLPSSLATPGASPVASPAASALDCGSPGFHPIVHEGVTAADLDAAGITGEPIVPSQDTTIEAANGTPIFLPAGQWSQAYAGDVIFVDDERATTVISLVTGDSRTFNASTESSEANEATPAFGPRDSGFIYTTVGPWLVGPANDTATDFWIINNDTGASLLTSDFFGAPFLESREAGSPTWENDAVPAIISFFPTGGVDLVPTGLVLPSADPDDAWALDPANADAAGNGVITADGSRVVFVDSPGNRIHVLDGFTGEQIASHPAPETDSTLRVAGLAGDDTTLLLSGDQYVWAVDIVTGETTTVLDPGGTVQSLLFDATTGTALVTTGSDQAKRHVWLDPGSGEVVELDVENLEQLPFLLHGWALLVMPGDAGVDYALLDMATGEIAAGPIHVNSAGNTMDLMNPFRTGAEHGIWIVPGEPGQLLALDGPGGRAFELSPLPEEVWTGWGGPTHSVSPNGECVIYSILGSGFGSSPGVTWVAPLEPGAEWTEVPFEITGWLEIPEG